MDCNTRYNSESNDCNWYNQYYTDVIINGNIVNEKCFNGTEVYKSKYSVN